MRCLRFIKWIVVPLALIAAYAVLGLPHVRWMHIFRDDGQGYDPLAPRHYLSCTFFGPFGRFKIDHPEDGKCAWIIFKKPPLQHEG